MENLLHWAKSQMEGMKIQPETFNLKTVTDENIRLLSSQAEKKKISLTSGVEASIVIFADIQMLNIVIRNLITNAVKFTKSGGVITLFTEEVEDFFKFSVKDTGTGISEENLKKLFSPSTTFTTIGTDKEKGTGTGPGLLLCKDFVEKNGGMLEVKSKLGEGSIFSFTIPKPHFKD